MSQDTRPAEIRVASGTEKPAVLKHYKWNSPRLQQMMEMFSDAVVVAGAVINSFLKPRRYSIYFSSISPWQIVQ
jgi:hypothetical protein